MKFSNYLWQQILPIYQEILDSPFCTELAAGKLSQERFSFYMQQDAYYLIHYSRTLALIAGRANTPRMIDIFLNFASSALAAKHHLHTNFLSADYSIDNLPLSPTCIAYPRYLIATATTASLEEAIASIVPCFWLYREVGHHVGNQMGDNNPYLLWKSTYSSQKFSDDTDTAIAMLDEMADRCSDFMLARIEDTFKTCSQFEWQFWNDAYSMNCFPKANNENRMFVA
ncbi:TenA family protein [Parachlamydia sp. AcF125]|uniref:TenA family protein n=1 Tax=Parachlamydia sp. AcF125 TaxID=2795736 RepID=UPI001BC8FF27|nr:TenA family protein [Parachlamydia sp. AcF125]MBS4167570.1 Aminopyrimidine aminohydrolase [Parachlamydia sp. AcF125]